MMVSGTLPSPIIGGTALLVTQLTVEPAMSQVTPGAGVTLLMTKAGSTSSMTVRIGSLGASPMLITAIVQSNGTPTAAAATPPARDRAFAVRTAASVSDVVHVGKVLAPVYQLTVAAFTAAVPLVA